MKLGVFIRNVWSLESALRLNGCGKDGWYVELLTRAHTVIEQISKEKGGLSHSYLTAWISSHKDEWDVPLSVADKIIALCDHVGTLKNFGNHWNDTLASWRSMRDELQQEGAVATPA